MLLVMLVLWCQTCTGHKRMEEFLCTLETRKALEERFVVQSYRTDLYPEKKLNFTFKFQTFVQLKEKGYLTICPCNVFGKQAA